MPEIGETLRDARMRARIDITEVEAVTKIRAKYLRALENEEWALLPGPTFVKTFLRTYAEFLGLDAKLLVEEYKLRHEGVSDLDLAPIAPPGMRPARSGRSQRQSRGGRRPPPPRSRSRTPQRQGPRVSRGMVVGAAVGGVLILLLVIGLVSKDKTDTAATTASTPTAVTGTVRTAPRTTATTVPPPRRTSVALVIRPTADVYVCVRNAKDKLLLSSTLSPGGRARTFRSTSLKVTVGNSSAVLRVNGKDIKVKPSADPTTYELTPRATKVLPSPANAC